MLACGPKNRRYSQFGIRVLKNIGQVLVAKEVVGYKFENVKHMVIKYRLHRFWDLAAIHKICKSWTPLIYRGYFPSFGVHKRKITYRKVASFNTSCLEAHPGFFRLLMKGFFEKKLIS